MLPQQTLSRRFDFLYWLPATRQSKQVHFSSKRHWSSQTGAWGEHDLLPREDQSAIITPANYNLMDGFKSALQAHKDSSENFFTEEEPAEITSIISTSKEYDTHTVADLSVGSSR